MRIHHISIRNRSSLLVALLCLIMSVAEASGQCVVTPIPVGDDSMSAFDSSVDLDGDIAVIGDKSDDLLGSSSGSVKVRRFNGTVWVEEAILTASNGVAHDEFGARVAVSGEVIAIGAPAFGEFNTNVGAAYIFRYNSTTLVWVEEAILTRPTTATPYAGSFGANLTLDGDVVAIADTRGAHIFRYNPVTFAWEFEQVVIIDDPHLGQWFPNNWLALDDDVLIAGEPRGTFDIGKGAVWIYRFDGTTWNLDVRIFSPSTTTFDADFFGLSVDVLGDMAVIGVPHDFDLPSGGIVGAVYVYEYDGANWNFSQKVVPANTALIEDRFFGTSLSLAADALLVGTISEDDPLMPTLDAGSVYHFKREGAVWVEQGRMFAPDSMEGDKFSKMGLAISGDRAIISSDRVGDVTGLGRAYIVDGFRGIGGPDCNNNDIADNCDILNFTSADTNTNGIPDECECLADTDGSGVVNVTDLLALLGGWGPNPSHPADINNDGTINVFDLLAMLASWGACP